MSDLAQQIASECLATRVRMINRVISGFYEECLRPHGLTIAQYNILTFVALMEEVQPSEIANLLQSDKSTLSRNLERMEKLGYIKTRTSGADRRGRLITMTRKGSNRLEKAHSSWQEAQIQTQSLLEKDGIQTIHKIAASILEKASERETQKKK